MKKIVLISTSLLCCFVFNLNAQFMKLDASFYSEALNEVKKVDIFLPSDYYENLEQQYPTIYYLHGAGGEQNSGYVKALMYYNLHNGDTTITSPPAIFVCPDGSCEPYLGSDWANSELYGNYEDYFLTDVISFIENNFRALSERDFRLICGTSMGGFGSAWHSVNHPEMFRASFPYIGFPAMTDSLIILWRDLVYEENGSYTNLNYNAGSNTKLFLTVGGGFAPNMNLPPNYVELPFDSTGALIDSTLNKYTYYDASSMVKNIPVDNNITYFLGCGTEDYMGTYPLYLQFMDSLDAYNISYQYNYFEGGHEYDAETWMKGLHWMDSIINYSYQTMGIEIIKQTDYQLMIYPNPISDQTKIEFTLSDNQNVCFDLYNMAGKIIRSSNFGVLSKGKHSISWNALYLPPGFYFLSLQLGNEVVTKKVVKL